MVVVRPLSMRTEYVVDLFCGTATSATLFHLVTNPNSWVLASIAILTKSGFGLISLLTFNIAFTSKKWTSSTSP